MDENDQTSAPGNLRRYLATACHQMLTPEAHHQHQHNKDLVGISQIGSFPQVGLKINNVGNHHLGILPLHWHLSYSTCNPNP